jgi:prephenate dehydrogenase
MSIERAAERGPVLLGRVLVIGTGLIGTSIALALHGRGVTVELADRDPTAVSTAVRRGAGRPASAQDNNMFDIVVIAVPPSSVVDVLWDAQHSRLGHCYTDVCSVKASIVVEARRRGCDMSTFVPGHPLAGSQESGPRAARADLFRERRWVLSACEANEESFRRAVEVVRLTDASPIVVDPDSHDLGVALSSHAPHVVSSALAAMFADTDPLTVWLAGRGVLDVTRIAAGPPELWVDILTHNAWAVAAALEAVTSRIRGIAANLRQLAMGGPAELAESVREALREGNRGREQLLESSNYATPAELRLHPALRSDLGGINVTPGKPVPTLWADRP